MDATRMPNNSQHHQQALVQKRRIASGKALNDQGPQTGAGSRNNAGRYRQGEARACDGRPVRFQEWHKAAKRGRPPAWGRRHRVSVGHRLLGRLDLGRCTKRPEGSCVKETEIACSGIARRPLSNKVRCPRHNRCRPEHPVCSRVFALRESYRNSDIASCAVKSGPL